MVQASPGVLGKVLPTEFQRSAQQLTQLLDEHQPQALIMLGVAETRSEINLENFALNIQNARIPDNAGDQPCHMPIIPEGPPAYRATLPLDSMLTLLEQHGLAACHSYEAGTFVCNHVFYTAMHLLAHTDVQAGFVHLPPFNSIPCVDQVRALRLMLEHLIRANA